MAVKVVQFRVEVFDMVQGECLRCCRPDRTAEFKASMMGQDHMLQEQPELSRESLHKTEFLRQHEETYRYVSLQFAFCCV